MRPFLSIARFGRCCLIAIGLSLLGMPVSPAKTPELPGAEELASFYRFLNTVNFSDENIGLAPKHGEGTSAYCTIQVDGKTWGAILPENDTNSVYGEIFSFNLARALGRPELSSPCALYVLKGTALQRFAKLMQQTEYATPEREANRQKILTRIANDPDRLETVVKIWGPKPYSYDAIATADERLNENDPFARFLRADQPQPSKQLVSLQGIPGSARECDLADQLSTIFLIDALAGQADRFSGGNVNAIVRNDSVQFVAYDNGGTWGDDTWLELYLSWVTRFDRDVVQRALQMNDFLCASRSQFLEFQSEADLQRALGLAGQDKYWGEFKHRLGLVARHIRAQQGEWFFRVDS